MFDTRDMWRIVFFVYAVGALASVCLAAFWKSDIAALNGITFAVLALAWKDGIIFVDLKKKK